MSADLFDKAMATVAAAAPRVSEDTSRPKYHFCTPSQWMNNVCGAYYDGNYHHVFFQFHPWSSERGKDNRGIDMGWGHARSRDLVRWEFLPPALLPSPANGDRMTASGSAIIRSDGSPLLMFTLTPIEFPDKKREQG